jgi:hypothetical protein
MRRQLERYYPMGHLHFPTFSSYRRKPLLAALWPPSSRQPFLADFNVLNSKVAARDSR